MGLGGIGKAMVSLYLAVKVAYTSGQDAITADMLEDVDDLVMGHEDAAEVAKAVQKACGMRRVV